LRYELHAETGITISVEAFSWWMHSQHDWLLIFGSGCLRLDGSCQRREQEDGEEAEAGHCRTSFQ
jgi:hypothetical protein